MFNFKRNVFYYHFYLIVVIIYLLPFIKYTINEIKYNR